jgi:hypothetical protein
MLSLLCDNRKLPNHDLQYLTFIIWCPQDVMQHIIKGIYCWLSMSKQVIKDLYGSKYRKLFVSSNKIHQKFIGKVCLQL